MIVAAVALGGCNAGLDNSENESEPDRMAIELSLVREKVAEGLKDPSSAQFRNVRRIPLGGLARGDPWGTPGHYCGEVNGKNSFGAYSGFQRFHAFGPDSEGNFQKNPVTIQDPSVPGSSMAYDVLCVDEKGADKSGIPVEL